MVLKHLTCHYEAVKQPDGLPGNSLGQRPRKKRSLIRKHAESVRRLCQPFRLERTGYPPSWGVAPGYFLPAFQADP